jgi:hypothetical protein
MGIFFIAFGQKNGNYVIQEFELVENSISEETMPEKLPTEVEEYDRWTRETEWCKVTETDNVAVYANSNDDDNLYVSWNGRFVKCNWEDARTWESGIEITESDIDSDGEKEILIILYNTRGSNCSGEDEFHLLDRTENDAIIDAVIPMDDFWKWVKKISKSWLNNFKVGELYIYTTTLTEDGISIEAEVDESICHPLGKINVQMVWKDKTLQVSSFTFTTDF